VSRHIVEDAYTAGVPHLAIVWTVPLTLMAGPAGWVAYVITKALWLRIIGKSDTSKSGVIDRLKEDAIRAWREAPTLTVLYVGVSAMALFMASWVLFAPSSWLVGNSSLHDQLLSQYWDTPHDVPKMTPKNLIFKYAKHRVVQFTHVLPSAVWSLAVPLQLYPGLRKSYPRLHRVSGYMFTVSALVMMVGLAVIDYRGLYYFKTDFPTIPEHEYMTRWPGILGKIPHREIFLGLGVWFTVTLLYSICKAQQKRFNQHRAFVYRHIAAGIWVAVQRIYVGFMATFVMKENTPEEQKMNFGDGAIAGALLTMCLAEVAVFMSQPRLMPDEKAE